MLRGLILPHIRSEKAVTTGPLAQQFYFTLLFSWKLQVTQVLDGFFSPLSAANKVDLCDR